MPLPTDGFGNGVNHKRQRMLVSGGGLCCLLPDTLLPSICEYLSFPSRAIFAAALTAPPFSWGKCNWDKEPSDASKIIAVSPLGSSPPNILDLSDVEQELANRLSDDDLGSMLVCIDAVHTVTKLKLAHCVNIIGHGLAPLQGSTVLRQIDLSLVARFESPDIAGEVWLEERVVIPILQSIITEGNSLTSLSFPQQWKNNETRYLVQFHENCAEHLNRGSHCCSGGNCDSVVRHGSRGDTLNQWFDGHGQHYTCYECGNVVCEECEEEELQWCSNCRKECCQSCMPSAQCETRDCSNYDMIQPLCSGCLPLSKCDKCNLSRCEECASITKCDVCGEGTCDICDERNEEWGDGPLIETCEICKRTLCSKCCKTDSCCTWKCDEVVCNDCQPKGWECMWCYKVQMAGSFGEMGYDPICSSCYKDCMTRCHQCHKKKLREEDYVSPQIPSSYWISRGYDEAYARDGIFSPGDESDNAPAKKW